MRDTRGWRARPHHDQTLAAAPPERPPLDRDTVRATMDLALVDKGEDTELRITSDVQIAGRIGEFGQPVIQRKADQLMTQFAECLARTLA